MAVVSRAPSPLTLCLVLWWSPLILTLFGRFVAAQEGTPLPSTVDGQHPEARYISVEMDLGYLESLHDTSGDEFSRNAVLQHEFRVLVDAGASQCYYQKFPVNAVLYVSFQVVRGLERYIELLITGPGNQVLEHVEWSADASMQKKIPVEGVYRLCLKNDKSQFSSKLIYFSLLTYKEEEFHEHRKNIQEVFDGTQGMEDSLETVDKRMKQVQLEQALGRRYVISDWYLLRDNNSYVQIMSIALCCIIMLTSAFQVFFVRRLFSAGSAAAGKKKPRA